ncbi:DUF4275 family protein [Metaplanococcus flavidus]|uniref:DUF4275 family protein n=1 Tax=Metaplanococcus flavidus TaxID=569883 RepID=A0ABW3LHD4_9BACL
MSYEVLQNIRKELEQKWEEAFTQDISKSQKRKLGFKQCMWNVFSWEKIKCLEGTEAADAFDQQKKAGCYLFYSSEEEAIYLPNAKPIKAKNIIHAGSPVEEEAAIDTKHNIVNSTDKCLVDLYVVDEKFSWTYILTHEEDFGPYFYKP